MSNDFAKLPEIRESLAGAEWDLVVADEAHRFTGARAELLRRLAEKAERIGLAAAPGMPLPDAFPIEDATVVDWRRDELADHDGKPLDAAPRPAFHEVRFTLTPAEQDLSEVIRALCEALDAGIPQSGLVARILRRSLHSSPAALENALRRLVERLQDQDKFRLILEEDADDGADEARSPELIDPNAAEKARPIAVRALQELETMRTDSKLSAFGRLLADLADVETPHKQICALTDFLGTLYYLAAEIEGQGLTCSLLHGGMRYVAREESLRAFTSTGGILVATRAVMTESLSLPDVTDLVLYDLPDSDRLLGQVLGRVDRFGRTVQLHIHALVQSDDADSAPSDSLRYLREMGSGQEGIRGG